MKPGPTLQERMLAATILRQPQVQAAPNTRGGVGPTIGRQFAHAHPKAPAMPAQARALALQRMR